MTLPVAARAGRVMVAVSTRGLPAVVSVAVAGARMAVVVATMRPALGPALSVPALVMPAVLVLPTRLVGPATVRVPRRRAVRVVGPFGAALGARPASAREEAHAADSDVGVACARRLAARAAVMGLPGPGVMTIALVTLVTLAAMLAGLACATVVARTAMLRTAAALTAMPAAALVALVTLGAIFVPGCALPVVCPLGVV